MYRKRENLQPYVEHMNNPTLNFKAVGEKVLGLPNSIYTTI